MSAHAIEFDYSLLGKNAKLAEEKGLASAEWYSSPIPRKRLKELMQRRNGPAILHTLLWFTLLGVTGYLGYHFWRTWWCVPCFIAYGLLYGTASDSRWHECGHRTAFRSAWMNDAIYEIASFMVIRESTSWRWSHTRHHTDTIIVGRDPEIAVPRPPDLVGIAMAFFILKSGPKEFKRIIRHCAGSLTPEEKMYVPESEWPRVIRIARIWALIYAIVIAWAIASRSILPLIFIGLPSFYGAWLMVVFGLTQHAGLAENVLDHRLNSRTIYMNPVFRFLYWNMNYHVEHHMFPMVPYYNLPALHAELKLDMPQPYRGLLQTYREIVPVLLKQTKDPTYFVRRELPAGAKSLPGDPGYDHARPAEPL